HALGADSTRAVARNFHVLRGHAAARRCENALALDLDHAGATVSIGPHAGLVTEPRDLDAQAIGNLDDGFAGSGGDRIAIQAEVDQVALEYVLEGSVHG